MIKVLNYPESNILYLNKEEVSSVLIFPEDFNRPSLMEVSMKNGKIFKIYYNSDFELELRNNKKEEK